MPVMNGLDATTRIKETEEGRKTVVLALTASAFEEDRRSVIASGVADFIAKPCREGELFDKIRRHLGVEYVYAEEESVRAPALGLAEAVAGLPEEWIRELREAISNGENDRLDGLVERVAARHPQLGDALRELAETYAYDELMSLLGAGQEASIS
jgi:CheY-like chemotaxis protein